MTLFETLLKSQAPTNFKKSAEYLFYKKNVHKLMEHERFAQLAKRSDYFGIIRSNIVLRALENKKKIEEEARLEGDTKKLDSLPFLLWEGKKIFVPLFAPSLASLYDSFSKELLDEKNKRLFDEYDLDLIDPFDFYGKTIYESSFAGLLPVMEYGDVAAMYDENSRSLYFINDQGRLDVAIAFFDKDLGDPDLNNVVIRAKIVSEAYFRNDKQGLINALFEQKFISEKLYERLGGGQR